MNEPSPVAYALAAVLSGTSPCLAQNPVQPPRVEIGLVTSSLIGARNLDIGIRTTIHGNKRTALDLQLDWADWLRHARYVDQQIWFYSWQVRHSFVQHDPWSSLLVSYGTLGWTERTTRRGGRSGEFDSYVLLPFLPLVGVGGQRILGSHAAVRGDLQFLVWPFESGAVHPRFSGGVSIPIGRYRN